MTPNITSRILVCREKHGTWYYDVSTNEQLHKTSVHILKERLEQGWYGPFYDKAPESTLGVSEEEIEAMPEGEAKKALQKLLADYKRELGRHKEEQAFLEEVDQAIKSKFNPDAKRFVRDFAWGILEGRSGYEYEEIRLESVESVE
jgi:hypothetical protein